MLDPQAWLEHLLTLDDAARAAELAAHRDAITYNLVNRWRAIVDDIKYDQPSRALALAEIALEAAHIAGQNDCRGLALWAKSHALMMLGRFHEGLRCCDDALALCAGAGQQADALGVQVSKVFAIGKLSEGGGWQAAVALAEAIRPELARLGEEEALARLDMSVGYAWHCLNHYDLALAAYERSCRIWSARDDRLQLARTRLNQGITFESTGCLEEALAAYEEARQALVEAGKSTDAARADLSIGCVRRLQGDYDRALRAFAAAYDGFARDRNEVEMAECRLYESELFLDLNRPAEVIWRCEESRPVFEREGIAEDLLLGQLLLARGYARRGQPGDNRRAEALLRDGADRCQAAGADASAALVRLHLADLLRSQAREQEALSLARAALEVFERHGQPVEAAWARLTAAFASLALRRYLEAEPLLREALALAEQRRLPQLAFRCHYGLGRLAEERGDLETAWREQRTAIQQVEALRGLVPPDDDLRSDFFDDKLDAYRSAVRLGLQRGAEALDEVFALIEQAKSRTLLEMLLRTQVKVEPGAADAETADLARQLQEAEQRWQEHRRARGYAALREGDIAQDPLRAGFAPAAEDADLQYRILELQRRLNLKSPRRGVFRGETSCDLSQVQVHLPAGTLLLEYFAAGPEWVVLAADRDRCTHHRLPGTGEPLSALCDRFDRSIARRHVQPEFWQALVSRDLQSLDEALMRPLADRLRGFRRLVIVPDAQLHHVPFHALHDGRRFLVEEFEISYAPSATILAHCLDRSRPATERSLLMAFSDAGRLPQTVHEVQAAARQLAHPALYLDADARKAVLASAADPLAVLHVATHGAVCYDNPLFSSLAFADGELAVWEVYDARLPAALAVLSACVTGRAIAKGTDLVGLTSAFLCAGAGALLTTLWEIHDESTPVFMGRLYDHLRRGENCAAALRQAQLDLLRAGPYRHPYYWAPFALSGDYGISL